MSFLNTDYQDKELDSYRLGTMKQGLKIGCNLDNYLVWKPGQFNLMIGVDNVGKTFFKAWYYTCLAKKHGMTFDIFSVENKVWSWKAKLISFYIGEDVRNVTDEQYIHAKSWVDNHFNFIDEKQFYTIRDLMKLFEKTESRTCLIDPLNALDEPSGIAPHFYNKQILKEVRHFCANTEKTVEIVGHAGTEGARRIHKDGEFTGLIMPPEKSHIDGGQIFANRCDDFLIIHRYYIDPYRDSTFLNVQKIKEVETGGKRTNEGEPLELKFVPYGFYLDGINPMSEEPLPKQEPLDPYGGMPSTNDLLKDTPF